MDTEFIGEISRASIWVTFLVSLPVLGTAMVVGLIISILQAATSIQEQTLTFVPKMVAIILALVIFGPWIGDLLLNYTVEIFDMIALMGVPSP